MPGKVIASTAVDVGKSVAGGFLNDYFARRSEERADKRNRALIEDTPSLQVAGRRKAGLNPYSSDVGTQLPGMSAQSQTEVPTGFNTLADIMAVERLNLEETSVNADKNLKDAQAGYYKALEDATRGGETRASEMHQYNIGEIVAKTDNLHLRNRILSTEAELKEYTLPNEKALSDLELTQANNLITQQIADILLTNVSIEEKKASIEMLQMQSVYLSAQAELAKAGVELTQAQVQEVWQHISTMSSEELLNLAKTDVEKEAIKEIKARVEQINAETKEIPANARVARNQKRFSNVFGGINALANLGSSAARLIGAIGTGGASEIGSGLVLPSSAPFSSKDVPGDIRFGR